MNTPPVNRQSVRPFQLLWTVGFSGKRFVDPAREAAIGAALRQTIQDLVTKATASNARLTAVSSLARGGDVLFVEAVREAPLPCGPLHWKGLLPFSWDTFIRLDLESDYDGKPLQEAERAARTRRAQACLAPLLHAPEVISPGANPADTEQREEAYLECGYRTVDESDVMIFLLLKDEYEKLQRFASGKGEKPKVGHRPGTFAVACYALATGRPMVILNAEAENIAASSYVLRASGNAPADEQWFVDPVVTDIVRQASRAPLEAESVRKEKVPCPHDHETAARESIAVIGAQLGALANHHQSRTRNGLRRVLRCHLAASSLAAVAATVLVVTHPETIPTVFLGTLALLACMKPVLAFAAWWLEHILHHDGTRDVWLNARVLAELCRSALATWPLPLQSINVQDEEVFPKVKRLVRTLRLMREQDTEAAVRHTHREPCETQVEADMRAACSLYGKARLQDQSDYYEGKHKQALAEELSWRNKFQWATWMAIIAGLALATDRFSVAMGNHLLSGFFEKGLEAATIIAPFLAAHCLSTMTILDTRRRCRRYAEMSDYLRRLANTLEHTEANPSRIRLIEHAERTLIEEQHEWLSEMRTISI